MSWPKVTCMGKISSRSCPAPSAGCMGADVLVPMVDPMIEIDGDVARIADDGLVRRRRVACR